MSKRSQPDVPADLAGVIRRLYADLDTTLSRRALALFNARRYDELLSLSADPGTYASADAYFRDCMTVNFLRKCVDVPLKDVDPEVEGMKAWHESERRCAATNARFESHLNNGPYEPEDMRLVQILDQVKKVFQEFCGAPPTNLDGARHGPGSTLRDRGNFATLPDKMSSRPTVTRASVDLLPLWYETSWSRYLCAEHSYNSNPEVCDFDRLVFVDKTAKIKRAICIGPSINLYFQLGVASIFRTRLKRLGIDLDFNQSMHRQVACVSSRDGKSATVDVKSASDSVARRVVRFLAHPSWYEVLDTLRCPKTLIGDQTYVLSKFSAMGNGFTFELETLIFLSIAFVATELSGFVPKVGKNVLVYGDDIIVPSGASRLLLAMLDYFGFKPNIDKTFVKGPFRESCGGDFFNGEPVRAHYLKEFPNEPQDWIALANGIRRSASVSSDGSWGRPYLRDAWFKCLDQIPTHIRSCRGPEELGDLLINDSHAHKAETILDEPWYPSDFVGPRPRGRGQRSLPAVYRQNGIRYYKVYRPISKSIDLKFWKPLVQLASALYGVPSEGPIPRDSVSGYTLCYVPFS